MLGQICFLGGTKSRFGETKKQKADSVTPKRAKKQKRICPSKKANKAIKQNLLFCYFAI
jgi:hypothetical protein